MCQYSPEIKSPSSLVSTSKLIRAYLTVFFYSTTHRLTSEPPTVEPFMPSQTFSTVPVHYWSIIAQRPESASYAQDLSVIKVELCHATSGVQREFIIISLCHNPTGYKSSFLLEWNQPTLLQTPTDSESGSGSESEEKPHVMSNESVFTPMWGLRAGIDIYIQRMYGAHTTSLVFTPSSHVSAAQLSVLLDNMGSGETHWHIGVVYQAIKLLSQGNEEVKDGSLAREMLGSSRGPGIELALRTVYQSYCQNWEAFKIGSLSKCAFA